MGTNSKRNTLLAVAAASLAVAGTARAQVQMTLEDFGTYAEELPSQSLPGGATWTPGGIIGVYSFYVDSAPANDPSGLTTGETFWSTCLSPGGEINGGQEYTFDTETFAQANPGINPSAWVTGGTPQNPQYWGIQNADYLWKKYGSSASGLQTPGSTPTDAGAALAMAMYVALYDSTGYGTYSDASGSKFVPTGLSSGVETDMNGYLGALDPTDVENNLANGYMLVPDAGSSAGQEFIILGSNMNNVSAPEPMATSMLGGLIAFFTVIGGSIRRKFLSRAR